jgi:xanthine/uracil permease
MSKMHVVSILIGVAVGYLAAGYLSKYLPIQPLGTSASS